MQDRNLTQMVESGELELQFPNNPSHPLQAYKMQKIIKSLKMAYFFRFLIHKSGLTHLVPSALILI